MVCTFGGHMCPGTPDGMFESWDGALTCVQVVRVPLVASMGPELMQDVLAQTLLTKVIKSQRWLRACRVVPQDFAIFCWLPFAIPDSVVESADLLMQRVHELDPRFSHRLRVPAEPGALFPAQFAFVSGSGKFEPRCRSVSESEVCAFTSTAYESDEDEERSWDITWSWDSEWCGPPDGADTDSADSAASEDFEFEWDITWDWQSVGCGVEGGDSTDPCTYGKQRGGVDTGAGFPWDDGG